MMLVWNNLADPHLSAFSDFAWFSQTVTLKCGNYLTKILIGLQEIVSNCDEQLHKLQAFIILQLQEV